MRRSVILFWVVVGLLLVAATEPEGKEEEEEEEDETEPPPPDGPPLVSMKELVANHSYTCEEHVVTTKDGYLLDVYHITCKAKPKGQVAILYHGLMTSSECYALKPRSVAYQLCDDGVDVWVPNMRGTVHGRKHKTLNPETDAEFWDMSYTEVGKHDVPAVIDYVKKKTKVPQVYYIGHSLGTSIFFVMLSTNPEYAASIKEAILLAPIVYATKYQAMTKEGSAMYGTMLETMKSFRDKKLWEAFPRADVAKNEHQIRCADMPEMVVGYCNMGFDMAKPVVGDFLPAGTSQKNIEHISQTYTKGKILFYDYGSEEENKKRYGAPTPPEIDIKKATMKVSLFYCEADHLVGVQDVETLKGDLVNPGIAHYIEDESFNHADFLFPMSEDTEKLFEDLMVKIKEIIK